MAIMWTAITYDVDVSETEVHFFIHHDANAVLSLRVALKQIVVDYHTHMKRENFTDGCMTIISVTHVTTFGVRVSLSWT